MIIAILYFNVVSTLIIKFKNNKLIILKKIKLKLQFWCNCCKWLSWNW